MGGSSADAHRSGEPAGRRRFRFLGGVHLFAPGWAAGLGAGVVSGLGWALAYPPVSVWIAVLLVVWPALWVSERAARRPGAVGITALWFGVGTSPAWGWLVRWTAEGSVLGFPVVVAYLSLFSGLSVWGIARLRRGWPRVPLMVVGPVVWVGLEYFRGRIAFDGFPWFLLSHPLIDAAWPGGRSLAWPAAWIGAYGVSGLAVFTVSWAAGVAGRPGSVRAWAPGLLVAVWLGGVLLPAGDEPGGPTARIGIVQTNLPQTVKGSWTHAERLEDWESWRRLMISASRGDDGEPADVIVFPETMFPGLVLQKDAAAEERRHRISWILEDDERGRRVRIPAWSVRVDLLSLQEELGVPVLIGAPRFEGFRIVREKNRLRYDRDLYFNSVFLIEQGEVSGTAYDKQHLTPFGEVMPYISAWEWLEQGLSDLAAHGMRFDVEAGRSRRVFELGGPGGVVRCVTPICFEATMASVCRGLVFEDGERRADLIVNMTNDGWFYTARGGREMHLLGARWRCVELATPMVRSANTGVSCWIDARGRVVESLRPMISGSLVVDVPLGRGGTWYAVVGDSAATICFIGAILWIVGSYTGLARPGGWRFRTKPGPDVEDAPGGTGSWDGSP